MKTLTYCSLNLIIFYEESLKGFRKYSYLIVKKEFRVWNCCLSVPIKGKILLNHEVTGSPFFDFAVLRGDFPRNFDGWEGIKMH